MSDWESFLRWYVVLTAATIAFYPLTIALGSGLGSARHGLSRPLGIVLLTAVVWWPAAMFGLPFTAPTLWTSLIVVGALLWTWWFRGRPEVPNLRTVVTFEALWLAAFLGYAWLRSYYPDIINTEKPMEIALLSSIVRSEAVPAPDPWLSGETINYYYFGYQVFGSAIKLSGVQAAVGFNLALATVFASTATAVASAAYGLGRGLSLARVARIVSASLATIMVLLAGNLETPRRLLRDTRGTIEAGWWDGVGWQASRIIVDTNVHDAGDTRGTINEFPAFSFVLGDLHPHVMTYPLLAAALAIAVGIALAGRTMPAATIAVAGALAGLLYASNSWDAPLGLLLLTGGLILAHHGNPRRLAARLGILMGGAIVAVFPFVGHYTAPIGVTNQDLPAWLTSMPIVGTIANTFGVVYWKPSGVRDLLIVHGLWIGAFSTLALVVIARDPRVLDVIRRWRHAALVVSLFLIALSVAWTPALILIGIPLAIAAWIVYSSPDRGLRLLAGLFGVGFTLLLVPEFVFLQDVFMDRMNTVFKFYFQAWLLLAVASAVAVVYVASRVRGAARIAVVTVASVTVALAVTYTPLSAWDWSSGFETRRGLNGMAYLSRTASDDLQAIDWIRSRARDGDWLVEAPGCSYMVVEGAPMSRISAFSGVPSLIGWYGHEGQWRRGEGASVYRILNDRVAMANEILNGNRSPSQEGPAFVVVGRQERFGPSHCDHVTERAPDADARLQHAGWVIGLETEQTLVFVPPWRASGPLTCPSCPRVSATHPTLGE